MATILGTPGDDVITGVVPALPSNISEPVVFTPSTPIPPPQPSNGGLQPLPPTLSSTVIGFDGNDTVTLPGSENIVFDGNGNDLITFTGTGFNTVYAGDGTDTVTFSADTSSNRAYLGFGFGDIINGGTGKDYIVAPGNHALINGHGGGDTIVLGGRHDRVIETYGTTGVDHIYAFHPSDRIVLHDFGEHPDWWQGPHGGLWVDDDLVAIVAGHHLHHHDLLFV